MQLVTSSSEVNWLVIYIKCIVGLFRFTTHTQSKRERGTAFDVDAWPIIKPWPRRDVTMKLWSRWSKGPSAFDVDCAQRGPSTTLALSNDYKSGRPDIDNRPGWSVIKIYADTSGHMGNMTWSNEFYREASESESSVRRKMEKEAWTCRWADDVASWLFARGDPAVLSSYTPHLTH